MTRFDRLTALAALAAGLALPALAADDACRACHADAQRLPAERARQIVAEYGNDVHATAGIGCHDCHGGDPTARPSGTSVRELHPSPPERPFAGTPARDAITAQCATCHADPVYMHGRQPSARTDQAALYRESRHGRALARGDASAPTCVDCHGAHGIRRASDPQSRLHPTRVAEACGACHSDPAHMAGRSTADGRPMPSDQAARWEVSVHGTGLVNRGDLFSPTCNDCHGDHGDLPVGLGSMSEVCASCHVREAELVAESPLGEGFGAHRGYMEEAEGQGCAGCHEIEEPAAALAEDALDNVCAACHSTHSVAAPSLGMFDPAPELACTVCHDPSTKAAAIAIDTAERLVAQGRAKGLTDGELFDWLLDRSAELPQHAEARVGPGNGGGAGFETLLAGLRVGPLHRAYRVSQQAPEERESIERCSRCHAEASADIPSEAFATAGQMRDELVRLTRASAAAAITLLAARREGGQVRAGQHELDQALEARQAASVAIHSFRSGPGTPLDVCVTSGLHRAEAARTAGNALLAEARGRKRWLAAALVLLAWAAVMVAWKLRDLGREAATEGEEA